MRLVRHDPFAEWLPFRSFLRDFPEHLRPPFETLVPEEDDLHVDEYTENGTLVIQAEMPGIDPDKDVDIEVVNGRLTIRAERKHEEETEERNYYRREMHYGAFARSLPLPAGAKERDVKATYVDGILEIRVPIDKGAETGKTKKVKVERAA